MKYIQNLIISIVFLFTLQTSWALATNFTLDFDGSVHIAVPHNNTLNLSTFTFEAWIKPQSPMSHYTILSKGEGGTANLTSYIFQIQNSKIGLFISETWYSSTTDVNADTWSHVAVSFDNSSDTVQFYLNGLPDGSASDSDPPYTGDANVFKIGEQGYSCNCNQFDGQMDELRVWNTVRTSAQIRENMNKTIPANETGLVAYYKFDQESGTNVYDHTTNELHGTFVNQDTAAWVESTAKIHQADGPGGVGGTNGVSELAIWLKADSFTGLVCGNTVSSWEDQSGCQIDFSQATESAKPKWYISNVNNMPTLRFDGTDDYLINPSYQFFQANDSPMSLFFVFKADALSSQRFIFMQPQTNGSNNMEIGYYTGSVDRGNFGIHMGSNNASVTQDNISTNYGIIGLHILSTGSAPNNLEITIDGTLKALEIDNTGWTTPGNYGTTANKLIIGGRDDANTGSYNSFHDGDISEIIVYSKKLNNASTTIIQNYLSSKYNIVINTDTYSGDSSPNGDFDLDVAGIGKESDGSHTYANSAGMILDNHGTFLVDDGDYVLIGHRATELTIVTDQGDLPANINRCWSRIWYLDKTDGGASANGNIYIGFDFSEAGLLDKYND